jgi:putative flippase GtrA
LKIPQLLARLWNIEFMRFGAVGTAAFVVDTIVLYLALWAGLGFYAGRVVSYLAAATFTWYGNRRITFETHARGASAAAVEWLKFLLTNLVGGAVNYAVYAALVGHSDFVRAYPVLGVAAGSIAGLSVNFTLSKSLVFRAPRDSNR